MSRSGQEEFTAFARACREKGLRLTPQRFEVFKELAEAKDHPGAETLHHRLRRRMPSLSLDTVYRTLGKLAEHGLIQRVETVESQARFEVPGKHHHLICGVCKEIMDFTWPEMDARELPPEALSWGEVRRRNVVAYGVCRKCSRK